MKIEDLAGLSKPLKRLIDVIARGCGAVYEPQLIRRNADAKAYEIKTITNALDEARKAHNLPVDYNGGQVSTWHKPNDGELLLTDTTIESRAERRIDYIERKRQNNIEKITGVAAEGLAADSELGDTPPSDDWIARFFACAQDINSEQMQDLWGRILSGEIKKPGSYSLRALDLIRNISSSDAELFERVGKFAIRSSGNAFVSISDKKWLASERGIKASDHFLLAELGIMYPTDLQIQTFMSDSDEQTFFENADHILLVRRGQIKSQINVPVWKFTSIGFEMLQLLPEQIDEDYIDKIAEIFTSKQGEVTFGKITERRQGDQISFSIKKKFEVEQVDARKPIPLQI